MLDISNEPAATELPPHTARPRPPGRPFKPGHSGNPAGRRAKPVDLGELCRRYAPRAVRALVRQLGSDDAQAAVNAAEVLLAHGYGEPLAHHALHVPRISIVCSTGEPATDHANGEAAGPQAWNA